MGEVPQDSQLAQDAFGLCRLDEAVVDLLDGDLFALFAGALLLGGRPDLAVCASENWARREIDVHRLAAGSKGGKGDLTFCV